ncbi:YbeD family protein [Helicobacter anatolicus]|uniref:HP0495 family protein n=1 Tax=Helicobacter anatolicus TaxID=2905874 RepID=UPI001E36C29B|nr:DUF493 domain-containing protein [Helicobacter anatolicus]MCE3039975.1 DUF493 domain-containing protein [Helicobacter anatolicus]
MKQAGIDYPCVWEYRIIGDNQEAICAAVFEILTRPYELKVANHSKKGRFISMHLSTEVLNQEERDLIFQKLLKSPSIKMVI